MSKKEPRLKTCFIALTAYPLLSGKNLGHIIGPDVYQVLLANALKKYFDISFITYDEGGAIEENIDGIRVIKTYRRKNRLNILLKFWQIWKAITYANANIYFQHGGAGFIVPLFCKLKRKRCIISIASDAYVEKTSYWDFSFRLSSRLEIMLADIIVVQSMHQRNMLEKNYRKSSILIKNPFPMPCKNDLVKITPPIVIWVGSIAAVKQPLLFLELARSITDASFQMIAAKGDDDQFYETIKILSQNVPNLTFLGFIPFNLINDYYRQASILVNTSQFEGFPNAFVQAWANHVPVVSLNADPDELICNYELGFHSKNFPQLINDVRTLLVNPSLRERMGGNGKKYAESEHDLHKVAKQYLLCFQSFKI